jgi:AcrR family transcriptional regulator
MRTAYDLFSSEGITAVGVDRIVAEAGVAKTTLYRQFRSKDDLAVAVLERHMKLWTSELIELEVERRATSPHEPSSSTHVHWLANFGSKRALTQRRRKRLKGDALDQLRGWRPVKWPPMFFVKGRICDELEVRQASTCARGGHPTTPCNPFSYSTEGHFAREPTAVHP